MRFNEIQQSVRQHLHETLDQEQSGFLTEDLVNIVEQHRSQQWSEPMRRDQLKSLMESWHQ